MEIKFRARIKENGKPKMFYQNNQYLISFLRRVTSFLAFKHDGKEGEHESYLKEYELEKCLDLYTGLKDKNGKEIYCGDTVKVNLNGNKKPKCVRTVVWKFSGFYFEINNGDYMPIHKYQIEVIGNIHENISLLNKKQ